MKIQKFEMQEVNLDVRGITLLSMEEYKEMKDHIPHLTDRWWLRSPGHIDRTHPAWRESVWFVNEYGIAHDNCSVDDAGVAVRPALEISDNTLREGDRFRLFDHDWTVISDRYALCDEPIGHMIFQTNWRADYANDYDESNVKRYIETWLSERTREMEEMSVGSPKPEIHSSSLDLDELILEAKKRNSSTPSRIADTTIDDLNR